MNTFEFSPDYMGLKNCPFDKWIEPHKEQVNQWFYRIYMQGYKDAIKDIEKEKNINEQLF